MKYFLQVLIALALSLYVISSCSKHEENADVYNFTEQVLQGKIGGENWFFSFGDAGFSYDSTSLSFYLYNTSQDSSCFTNTMEGQFLFFSIPAQAGYYPLVFDFSSTKENFTVKIFDQRTENESLIVTEGAVEIFIIDYENKFISGQLNAIYDNENFVEGQFTASFCTESE